MSARLDLMKSLSTRSQWIAQTYGQRRRELGSSIALAGSSFRESLKHVEHSDGLSDAIEGAYLGPDVLHQFSQSFVAQQKDRFERPGDPLIHLDKICKRHQQGNIDADAWKRRPCVLK